VVRHFVALCVRCGRGGGKFFILRELWVEADEEIVVVEKREGVGEGRAWWERRDVVKRCRRAEGCRLSVRFNLR
jgi:hypothetical protein